MAVATILDVVTPDYQFSQEFEIHDNGGRPFRIQVQRKKDKQEIVIWERDWLWNPLRPAAEVVQVAADGKFKKITPSRPSKPIKTEPDEAKDKKEAARKAVKAGHRVIEEDKYGWMTEGLFGTWKFQDIWIGIDLDQPAYAGNTVLFSIEDRPAHTSKPKLKYIFVHRVVEEIDLAPGDRPCALMSPVGNNDVPYPIIIGTRNSYVMPEGYYISNRRVPACYLFPRRYHLDLVDIYHKSRHRQSDPSKLEGKWSRMKLRTHLTGPRMPVSKTARIL